jgi:hypothetical protein
LRAFGDSSAAKYVRAAAGQEERPLEAVPPRAVPPPRERPGAGEADCAVVFFALPEAAFVVRFALDAFFVSERFAEAFVPFPPSSLESRCSSRSSSERTSRISSAAARPI